MNIFFNKSESRLFKQISKDLTNPWIGHFLDNNDLIPNYYTNSLTVLSFQWELFTTIVMELVNFIKSLIQSIFYLLTLNNLKLQESLFQVFKAPIVALARMALITGVGFLHLTRLSSLTLSNLTSILLFVVTLPITLIPLIMLTIESDENDPNETIIRNLSLASGSLDKFNISNKTIQSERELIIETLLNFHFTYNNIVKCKNKLPLESRRNNPTTKSQRNKEKLELRADWYKELAEKIDNYPSLNTDLCDNHEYTEAILEAIKIHHADVIQLADKYFKLLDELCIERRGIKNKDELNNMKPDDYTSAPPSNGIFM